MRTPNWVSRPRQGRPGDSCGSPTGMLPVHSSRVPPPMVPRPSNVLTVSCRPPGGRTPTPGRRVERLPVSRSASASFGCLGNHLAPWGTRLRFVPGCRRSTIIRHGALRPLGNARQGLKKEDCFRLFWRRLGRGHEAASVAGPEGVLPRGPGSSCGFLRHDSPPVCISPGAGGGRRATVDLVAGS